MMETSFVETVVDLAGLAKEALALSEENFSAVLNWICQAGTSPGIAVSTPAFASQQHSKLQRGDEKCWANAVWTGESAPKCLLDLVVMVGHFFLSQFGTFGHVSNAQKWISYHRQHGLPPQGFSSLQRSACALSTSQAGACTSCALENASDPIKPLWRRKTEITWKLREEAKSFHIQEFYIPLHRSVICVWKNKSIVEESKS